MPKAASGGRSRRSKEIDDMHCSIHRKNRRRAWSRCRKCGRGLRTSTCVASSICFDANRLSPARKKCPSSARPARRRSARRLPCPHPVEEQTNSSRRSQDSGDLVVNLCMSGPHRPSLAIWYEKQARVSPTPNGDARVYYPGTEEAHTNPTRQRGECLRALAGASG